MVDIRINLSSTAPNKWSKYKSHINTKKLRYIVEKGLELVRPDLPKVELSVLLSDDKEMQGYNAQFRGVDKPTNVLSFPSRDSLKEGESFYLGDIALGFTTVATEGGHLGVPLNDYTYYLFVHGLLHLLGYVHDKKKDRDLMESLERAILKKIGIDAQRFR